MGRPRKHADSTTLTIRLPAELKARLQAEAQQAGTTVNDLVLNRLTKQPPPKNRDTKPTPTTGVDKQAELENLRRMMAQPRSGMRVAQRVSEK